MFKVQPALRIFPAGKGWAEAGIIFRLYATLASDGRKVGAAYLIARELWKDAENRKATAEHVVLTLLRSIDSFLDGEKVQNKELASGVALFMEIQLEKKKKKQGTSDYAAVPIGRIDTEKELLIKNVEAAVTALFKAEEEEPIP